MRNSTCEKWFPRWFQARICCSYLYLPQINSFMHRQISFTAMKKKKSPHYPESEDSKSNSRLIQEHYLDSHSISWNYTVNRNRGSTYVLCSKTKTEIDAVWLKWKIELVSQIQISAEIVCTNTLWKSINTSLLPPMG